MKGSRVPKVPAPGVAVRIGKVSAENKAVRVVISPVHHPVDQGENWFKLRQELIGLAFHGPHWGSSPPRRAQFQQRSSAGSARAFQPQFPSRATTILNNERARAQSNNGK